MAFTRRGLYRKHVDGREVLADPATVVFYPRWEEYRISHPLPGGDRCLDLVVDDEALDELARPAAADAGRPFAGTHGPLTPRGALLARRLTATLPLGDAVEIEETALGLAAEALRARSAAREPGVPHTAVSHRRAVGRATLALCARFREALTLEVLAREACYSPYHFCRIFKRETGLPVHRYLNRLRLLAALESLDQGVDLTRLAISVGFSSHSHFTSAFRREFGAVPSRILRRLATLRLDQLPELQP
jgi:AraC-like DNA-binding protein